MVLLIEAGSEYLATREIIPHLPDFLRQHPQLRADVQMEEPYTRYPTAHPMVKP
jgi:hypothetical protein